MERRPVEQHAVAMTVHMWLDVSVVVAQVSHVGPKEHGPSGMQSSLCQLANTPGTFAHQCRHGFDNHVVSLALVVEHVMA